MVPPGGTRPKPKLVLVNLVTMEKTEIEGAAGFQFAGESSTHIAYRKAGDSSPAPTGLPPGIQLPPGLRRP